MCHPLPNGSFARPIDDFGRGLFKGTAQFYARYRLPYPPEYLDNLRLRACITGGGRLLDLGCGPGRVTLPMSPFFREVWAVDLEPEMIEVGRKEAAKRGITNVRWIVGPAEEVKAAMDTFELITIGEAFHRLDRQTIAERGLTWLRPGCCLITMGCFGIATGSEPWQGLLRAAVNKWGKRISEVRATIPQAEAPRGSERDEEVLTGAGYEDVESYDFRYPYMWTVESIIGNLYSTSNYSKRVLGNWAEQFEADVTRVLLDYDSSGHYPETVRFGYTVARKPPSQQPLNRY